MTSLGEVRYTGGMKHSEEMQIKIFKTLMGAAASVTAPAGFRALTVHNYPKPECDDDVAPWVCALAVAAGRVSAVIVSSDEVSRPSVETMQFGDVRMTVICTPRVTAAVVHDLAMTYGNVAASWRGTATDVSGMSLVRVMLGLHTPSDVAEARRVVMDGAAAGREVLSDAGYPDLDGYDDAVARRLAVLDRARNADISKLVDLMEEKCRS